METKRIVLLTQDIEFGENFWMQLDFVVLLQEVENDSSNDCVQHRHQHDDQRHLPIHLWHTSSRTTDVTVNRSVHRTSSALINLLLEYWLELIKKETVSQPPEATFGIGLWNIIDWFSLFKGAFEGFLEGKAFLEGEAEAQSQAQAHSKAQTKVEAGTEAEGEAAVKS